MSSSPSDGPTNNLWDVGWNDDVAARVAALMDADHGTDRVAGDRPVVGRVGRVDRGECDVFTEDELVRVASDSVRAQADLAPATGDWVIVTTDPDIGRVIGQIVPRRTAIVRRDPSEHVIEQTIVANVDVVAVVHGLDQDVNPARIERFLVLAEDSGADPVVVLTKSDLVAPDVAETARDAANLGNDVPVLVTSAVAGAGLDQLRSHLVGNRTLVLIGPSGAGKSHLVNALAGEERQAVGAVREGDAKGRHTTTTRELIPLDGGGVLIDTPGIRAVGVWNADVAIDQVFADVASVAEECKFRDCTHRMEPGCAVREAIDAGELDADRVSRYATLWAEIADQAEEAEERRRKRSRGKPRPPRRKR